MNETAWKGSREGWLSSAYEALVEGGVDAVKILPLAKKLNVSRTSFYWFFTDREQLLDALLAEWQGKNTAGIEQRCEAYAETIAEAMLNIMDCWLNPSIFDSQFEFAVRSWALQSPDVAAKVFQADEARLKALAAMFARFGFSELDAEVRARTVYLVQIGYISMSTREDLALRMRRIPSYVQIYTGHLPERREMERFASRHNFILEPDSNDAEPAPSADKEV